MHCVFPLNIQNFFPIQKVALVYEVSHHNGKSREEGQRADSFMRQLPLKLQLIYFVLNAIILPTMHLIYVYSSFLKRHKDFCNKLQRVKLTVRVNSSQSSRNAIKEHNLEMLILKCSYLWRGSIKIHVNEGSWLGVSMRGHFLLHCRLE